MSLLRIRAPLDAAPARCEWALLEAQRLSTGEGTLAQLPRGAQRVQFLVPAAQALITRATLPRGARRRAGPVLAFAVEEASAAEPEANQVSWLGALEGQAAGVGALAVIDKAGLRRWRDALQAVGLREFEVHTEILLLPRASDEWSLAWDGGEGFVRTGDLEGAATDGGDAAAPPLALAMMLEEARACGAPPRAIAVYLVAPGTPPDASRWEAALGVPLRLAGAWDWRTASAESGVSLAQERRRWRLDPATIAKLRPAAWIAGAALALHGVASVIDWAQLAAAQRAERGRMEARFRATFPQAVAVADPALQMRRQLALARHRAGVPDGGDFAPMLAQVAAAMQALPAESLRLLSYEGGRMTLELGASEPAALARAAARLAQSGLIVDAAAAKRIAVRAP